MLKKIYYVFHGFQKSKKNLINLDIVEYIISSNLKLLSVILNGL